MQGLKNAWKYRNAYDGTRLVCTHVGNVFPIIYFLFLDN